MRVRARRSSIVSCCAEVSYGYRMRAQIIDWFCGGLGYEYVPAVHGSQPEWLADLISTSFTQPLKTFKRSMRTRKARA